MEDEFEQFRARAYGRSARQQQETYYINDSQPPPPIGERTNRRNHPRRSRLKPAATEICSTHYDNDSEVQEASVESQKVRRHSAMGILSSDSGIHHYQIHRRHHKYRQFLPLAEASPADEGYHNYRVETIHPVAKSPSYASSRSSVRSDHTSNSSTGIYSSVHTPVIMTAATDITQQQLQQPSSKLQQLHSRDSGHLSSSSSSLQANTELNQNSHFATEHQSIAASETSISSRKSNESSGMKVRNQLTRGQHTKRTTDSDSHAVRFSMNSDKPSAQHDQDEHLYLRRNQLNSPVNANHVKEISSKKPCELDPGHGQTKQRRSSTCGVLEKPLIPLLSPSPTRDFTKNLSISPAANRRNSCFVGLPTNSRLLRPALSPCGQSSGAQQPPQVYNIGRRNSAITYLTDTSPFRTKGANMSVPPPVMMRTSSGESSAWKQRQPVEQLRESSLENDSRHGNDDGEQEANADEYYDDHHHHPHRHRVKDNNNDDDDDDYDDDDALNGSDVINTVTSYHVLVTGSNGVGKTTLTRQLLTSEYLANKNGSDQELSIRERTSAAVRLDGEESTVNFTEWPTINSEMLDGMDACIVVYSVNDRNSFHYAQTCLTEIRKRFESKRLFLMLVANKQDLVRNRIISAKEGKKLATKRHCKFMEVSALLDHKVDKVLEGVIRGTRSLRTRLNLMGGMEEGEMDDDGSQRRSNKMADDCCDEDDEDAEEKTCFYRVFRSCVKMF